MFVTSDIYDLKHIGRFRDFEWKENLLCGVDIRGSSWPGYQAAATFFLEAAKCCGLLEAMEWAGYNTVGKSRTRSITPRSFARLARGELPGAADAVGVLLRGSSSAAGAQSDYISFGGEAGGSTRADRDPNIPPRAGGDPSRPLRANFIFPLNERPVERATELIQLAIDLLGAEYGYYFVRDDLCFPGAYTCGVAPALDYSPSTNAEGEEIRNWSRFAGAQMWVAPWPLLRDLYEVNLISERHTAQPIEGLGLLTEWIEAEPGRGLLRDLGRGRWLWTLTDLEIFNVRPVLHKAGLLLSCHDRIYRDLPGLSPPRRNNAAVSVRTTDQALYVLLADGRELSAPLGRFPRLRAATPEQRAHWHIFSEEQSISWPDVEEYIMVETLLRAR